ncbi:MULTISPECIES: hypothetical protein [Chryseobacterium]|uniref:Uncharacterized protein n=1 Tax=Chryseobacterium candidae TaxID=1978493 RepID=A0ABY2R331_9FLAO|nr:MULTISPECIES: hypothetical protein [Chryseobacterium]THV56735.1 hypothetical protein EK417_18665 [Chryseobacterium candidae]SIQ34972.1 hypothetical protein SAMN05880573_104251 [Chryseobacterium sp. RU33C]
MSKKKLLIHEVFEKARKDFPAENTKNGWCKELVDHFEKKLNFIINEKTFVRYYDACIRDSSEPNIKDIKILNKLSEYVGYVDFAHFSNTFIKKEEKEKSTTVKIDVDDNEELFGKGIRIIITQYFNLPEFIKKNGLGITGIILIGSVLLGNYKLPKGNDKIQSGLGFFGAMTVDKDCMFWDKSEYKLANCEDKNPLLNLIPKDTVQIKYFKRITRKDTLTVGNAMGKTWYSKFNGNVEFFTMDGVDPDTGRELRSSTPYIIGKYAGPSFHKEVPAY